MSNSVIQRCQWSTKHQHEQDYHDTEWGVPVYDDRHLFEMLTLEGAQAGLSWSTVLAKRAGYKKAFSHFNIETVAKYSADKMASLKEDSSIVRHQLKIASTVSNAKAILQLQKEFGSFSEYLWRFVDHKPIQNNFQSHDEVPASTPLSDKLSKDLKRRGFKFVGTVICYAFMQGIGMVNDHVTGCFRHQECST